MPGNYTFATYHHKNVPRCWERSYSCDNKQEISLNLSLKLPVAELQLINIRNTELTQITVPGKKFGPFTRQIPTNTVLSSKVMSQIRLILLIHMSPGESFSNWSSAPSWSPNIHLPHGQLAILSMRRHTFFTQLTTY